jgi:hypothetical protein
MSPRPIKPVLIGAALVSPSGLASELVYGVRATSVGRHSELIRCLGCHFKSSIRCCWVMDDLFKWLGSMT